MTEHFLKQLKQLQDMKPGKEYSEKSLRLILAVPQNDSKLDSLRTLLVRVSLVGAMVVVALFVVSESSLPMRVAGLDVHDLRAEAQVLENSLKIAEINEVELKSRQTNTALEESAKSDPIYLNTTVLEREVDVLNIQNLQDDSIDRALEEIIK